MTASDLDIQRSAHLWIQTHGDAAPAKAREMVEEMRSKGDHDGADTWLRIIDRDDGHAADKSASGAPSAFTFPTLMGAPQGCSGAGQCV